MVPQLVNARRAKLMSGSIDKTDRLDARGIHRLLRAGTLPTLWIPPRDARELPKTRMVLARQRMQLKNRIHSTLAEYGLKPNGVTDLFGVCSRQIQSSFLGKFPAQTRYATDLLIESLGHLQEELRAIELRMSEQFGAMKELELNQTLPELASIFGELSSSQGSVMWSGFPAPVIWLRMLGRDPEDMPVADTFATAVHDLMSITA